RRGARGRRTATGERRDHTAGVDLPHLVVPGVGDVDVPAAVDGNVARGAEARRCGRATVAHRTGHAGAGERGDGACRVDLAHLVVAGVGDVHVPVAVDRDALGRVEERRRRGTAVTRRACGPG